MWVADMDFKAPPCVLEELHRRVEHGIFGYSEAGEEYFDTLKQWFQTRHNWTVEQNSLTLTFGIVNAVYLAVRALTSEGDGVIIQQPVYYPFEGAVSDNRRKVLNNGLIYENGRYAMDLNDFEEKAKLAKVFILCNPHNPVGRVWTRDELKAVGDICVRYGVTVISDEIHQDFIFAPSKHTVFADISPEFADITITCTAPSKTFNLAGLTLSNIFIDNKEIRRKFRREYEAAGLSQPSLLGFAACQAAYSGGVEWLEQLVKYLAGNLEFTRDFLVNNVPSVKLIEPEGTYLLWFDFRELNVPNLDDFILNKAKLWLDGGTMFGASGKGFQRLNMACPRSTLEDALLRIKNVC
jgi:cystathionine beta-lyase